MAIASGWVKIGHTSSAGPVFEKLARLGSWKVKVFASRLGVNGSVTGPSGSFSLGRNGTFQSLILDWDDENITDDRGLNRGEYLRSLPPKSVESRLKQIISEGHQVVKNIKLNRSNPRRRKYRVRKNFKKYSRRSKVSRKRYGKRRR